VGDEVSVFLVVVCFYAPLPLLVAVERVRRRSGGARGGVKAHCHTYVRNVALYVVFACFLLLLLLLAQNLCEMNEGGQRVCLQRMLGGDRQPALLLLFVVGAVQASSLVLCLAGILALNKQHSSLVVK
jgi:hypothetical protein